MLDTPVLLCGESLVKDFRRGIGKTPTRAVDGVDLSIRSGEIVALVGESGSGKTTLGRLLLRLIMPTTGRVRFDGRDLGALTESEMRAMRRRMQIVFQCPSSTFDPRLSVGRQVAEPLEVHFPSLGRETVDAKIGALAADVGLTMDQMKRAPHELSGGELQRAAIARALSLSPDFIVADEPVTALDAVNAAHIAGLLSRLQRQRGVAILFITHDLRLARQISRRTLVMYGGQIMEEAETTELCREPLHPYTRHLVGAPAARCAGGRRQRASGCPFAPQCPEMTRECGENRPALAGSDGRRVACHHHHGA